MMDRRICLGAALVGLLVLAGCSGGGIRKAATITSDPPGAKVWINGVYRGETPVEVPYNWNWYYDVQLEKAGYEPMVTRERFYAPAKHWIPADIVAEMSPVASREDQWRHYCMKPRKEP